ncbi:uncharacterized protein LOC128724391 [Anopheles nili]|uniref:uncharacterized protein LOC128724391 n=1 Tax=Anopheles nili TaxID=185578 RepID=UPI00237C0DB7|nr:uncharacterized protein LOC128724391 [Anopheles nili]
MLSHHLVQNLKNKICPLFYLSRKSVFVTPPAFRRSFTTSDVLYRKAVVKREDYFLKKDNIPPGFNIIYRAPMEYYLTACNIVTSFSFAALGSFCVYTYWNDFRHIVVPFEIEHATLTANETDLLYFLGFFLLINVVIRVVINRYPLRIYRNDKKYLAVFEGQIPLITKKFNFQRGDVAPVPLGGILPWQESRYKINDKNVLLLEDYFRAPSELVAMMSPQKADEEH